MKVNVRKITDQDIKYSTDDKIHRIDDMAKRVEKMLLDPDKDARMKAQLCQYCFYAGTGMGGAAMTTSTCGCCEKETMYGSTNVDKVCMTCAQEKGLCKHCACKVDLKIAKAKNMLKGKLDSL